MVRALSAGKLSSFREGAQLSGVWTSSWLKMKAQNRIFPRSCVALAREVAGCLELKMEPPQKVSGSHLSQKLLASVFHTLTCAACPPRSPGTKVAPAEPEAETSWAGGPLCSHQEGGKLSGAENGVTSEALCLSPVPEVASLCIPHSHLCRLPSAESWNQDGSHGTSLTPFFLLPSPPNYLLLLLLL